MNDREDFYKQLGQKIRNHRGKSLSQEAIASAVGLTRTSISNIEAGRQKLLLHTFVDIANALNVEITKLLPERPAATESISAEMLATLADNERVFIEAAIGIKQKESHGCQEKED